MDRTAELWRVAQLTNPQLRQQHLAPNITGLSDYMKIALRISAALDNTDTIVQKILKLSQQKEFSNDPTTDMTNVSDIFQQRVGIMQADLERLKRHNAQHPSLLQQQHHKLILQSLSNRLSEQLDKFKSAIKVIYSMSVRVSPKRYPFIEEITFPILSSNTDNAHSPHYPRLYTYA